MVETIRYSKIYADDIAIGTGTAEVTLAGGEVVEMDELNITHLVQGSANQVVYASTDGSVDDDFFYNPSTERLYVKKLAADDAAAADLSIDATSHATPGNIILNAAGGKVGIGTSSPDTLLHVSATSGNVAATIDATGADAALIFALAATETWYVGLDQSDSNKLKVGSGGTVGTNAHLTLNSSGHLGIGETAPDAALHVLKGTTTSTTVSTDADEIIAESNGDAGISIITPNTDVGTLRFSRPSDPLAGYIQYDHNAEQLTLGSGSAARLTFDGGSTLLGTTTANSYSTQGLTIDQGANDDHALTLRSSDIAHGITDIADTSAYCYATKFNAGQGGLLWVGVSEGAVGIGLTGVVTAEVTTTLDTSAAAVALTGFLKSGTGTTDMQDTANVVQVRNRNTTIVLIKGDGDVHNSGGATAMGTYDDHDDVQLLQTVKGAMDPNYRQTLGEWVDGHTETLERGGVITRGERGWFISQRGWRGLLIDAIGQLARRIEALEQRGAGEGA